MRSQKSSIADWSGGDRNIRGERRSWSLLGIRWQLSSGRSSRTPRRWTSYSNSVMSQKTEVNSKKFKWFSQGQKHGINNEVTNQKGNVNTTILQMTNLLLLEAEGIKLAERMMYFIQSPCNDEQKLPDRFVRELLQNAGNYGIQTYNIHDAIGWDFVESWNRTNRSSTFVLQVFTESGICGRNGWNHFNRKQDVQNWIAAESTQKWL